MQGELDGSKLIESIDHLTEQVKRVGDLLEKQPSKGNTSGGPPCECYVCKKAGQSVQIRLRRKAKELIKDGESPFDFFNLDGTKHVHMAAKSIPQMGQGGSPMTPTQKDIDREKALQGEIKREQGPTSSLTAAANTDQIMNFLRSIWPTKTGPAVTDAGECWIISSPYLEDRDQWKELARQIRDELNGEYVSDKEARQYYFRVPKPVVKL